MVVKCFSDLKSCFVYFRYLARTRAITIYDLTLCGLDIGGLVYGIYSYIQFYFDFAAAQFSIVSLRQVRKHLSVYRWRQVHKHLSCKYCFTHFIGFSCLYLIILL